MKKVNIGCGKDLAEGWIGIDNSPKVILSKHPLLKWLLFKLGAISESVYREEWNTKIKRHDVRKGLPFKNEEVDYIYCSHLIEHLTREGALKLCKEVYRVLKTRGLFRVVAPDLKLMAEKYIEGDKEFFKNKTGRPIADLFMSANMFHDFHKWAYDMESMKYLLIEAGFKKNNIFECNYKQGKCPDLEEIDHGGQKSIFLEAIK